MVWWYVQIINFKSTFCILVFIFAGEKFGLPRNTDGKRYQCCGQKLPFGQALFPSFFRGFQFAPLEPAQNSLLIIKGSLFLFCNFCCTTMVP